MKLKYFLTFLLILLILSAVKISFAQTRKVDEIKKTIVFLGEFNSKGDPFFYGTGFLIQIDSVDFVVTNKHVIMDYDNNLKKFTGKLKDTYYEIFFNNTKGQLDYRSVTDIKSSASLEWIFHPKDSVDLAVLPFPILETDDLLSIGVDFFVPVKKVLELFDVFFLCYNPGLETKDKIIPIIRKGMVSYKKKDRTFYIDGFAFPGNSGSPVFLFPSFVRKDSRMDLTDSLAYKFIGIISEYLPYRDEAVSKQTKQTRIIFEENSGLSRVWPTDFLTEIIATKKFQDQLATIKRIRASLKKK